MMKTKRIEGEHPDARDILKFLEQCYREGTCGAIPARFIPALRHYGWAPDPSTGDYLFPVPKLKRLSRCPLIDKLFSFFALILALPLFLIIAIAICCDDGRPVFFIQSRSGYRSRQFNIIKFRSMYGDGTITQAELMRRAKQNDRAFKLNEDPRITHVGAFLRKRFLDELPQLINVLRGEMRLVGPRPLPAYDHGQYHRSDQALRLLSVPGITGMWQVTGRNHRTFDEMCILDYYGICNASFATSFKVILRTIRLLWD